MSNYDDPGLRYPCFSEPSLIFRPLSLVHRELLRSGVLNKTFSAIKIA